MNFPQRVAPAFRHLVHSLNDPEEFGIAVSGASLVAEFLQPRQGVTWVEQFQSPAWAWDFHEAQVKARIIGAPPPGWGAIALLRGRSSSSWYGQDAGLGSLVFTPPGAPIDGHFSQGFQCVSLGVPPGVWENCRLLAGTKEGHPPKGGSIHRVPIPLLTQFESRLSALRHHLRAANTSPHLAHAGSHEATALACDLITSAWELSGTSQLPRDSSRNRARLARRAEAWMRAHLGDPIHISDLCLVLRVSRRELEYAFRQTFDQSPRDYLQTLRLNAIRRALRRSDRLPGQVSRIATEHGITHFGRFAAHFRALFGENPGESLRSA